LSVILILGIFLRDRGRKNMDKTYSGSKQKYSGSKNNEYSMKRIGQKEEGNKEGRKEGKKEGRKEEGISYNQFVFVDPEYFFLIPHSFFKRIS
jgi:hypothetical protein